MTVLLAIVIGVLYAAALYMMLRRSIVKLIIGLGLFGHGASLLVFTAGGFVPGRPPLVEPGQTMPEAPFTDPLPPALILTALVINFGVLAFAMVLVKRAYQEVGNDDLNEMRTTDT